MLKASDKIEQPLITKHLQTQRAGIQLQKLSRYAIGYVVRGRKYIYYGDVRYEVNNGDMFLLDVGYHYIEDVPEATKAYEQIVFYYSHEMLTDILNNLSRNYHLDIDNSHQCGNCNLAIGHVVYPAWSVARNFFATINQYIKEGVLNNKSIAEKLKMTELVYLIISSADCCIKNRILNNIALTTESLEVVVCQNVFSDIGVEELAKLCNKSLTTFKKEFKSHFNETPHQWLMRKRLMRSRLLLMSTNKPVAEIGMECNYPNTSHFIKLFRDKYGDTPAVYRQKLKVKSRMEEQGADVMAEQRWSI